MPTSNFTLRSPRAMALAIVLAAATLASCVELDYVRPGEPLESVTATLTARYGALPGALVASPWCVGREVPGFSDAALAARARELLERGCPYSP